jgi:hypothetical protein
VHTAGEPERHRQAEEARRSRVPPRIASFTGRADELDRLDAIPMRDTPAAVRAAVQGMGGVGKTALAIEYAHRFRGLFAGVYWCPAETPLGGPADIEPWDSHPLSRLESCATSCIAMHTGRVAPTVSTGLASRKVIEDREGWLK